MLRVAAKIPFHQNTKRKDKREQKQSKKDRLTEQIDDDLIIE